MVSMIKDEPSTAVGTNPSDVVKSSDGKNASCGSAAGTSESTLMAAADGDCVGGKICSSCSAGRTLLVSMAAEHVTL